VTAKARLGMGGAAGLSRLGCAEEKGGEVRVHAFNGVHWI